MVSELTTMAPALALTVSGPPIVEPVTVTPSVLADSVTGPLTWLDAKLTAPPDPCTVTGPDMWSGAHELPMGPPRSTGPEELLMVTGPDMEVPHTSTLAAPFAVMGPETFASTRASAPPGGTLTGPLTEPPSTQVLPVTLTAPLEPEVMVWEQVILRSKVPLEPV